MIDPELIRMSQAQSHSIMAVGGSFEQNHHLQPATTQGRAPEPTSDPIDSRVQNTQYRGAFDYPSPSAPSFESMNFSAATFAPINADSPLSPPSMLPPVRAQLSSRQLGESADSFYMRHKRSHSAESPATSTSFSEAYSPNPGPPTPYNPFVSMPLTPNSSVGSEDAITRTAPKAANPAYPPPDLRRLSVQSLLTGPPGDHPHGVSPDAQQARQYPIGDSDTTTYGYDLGYPDLDTPKNDDINAIAIFSPRSDTMDIDGTTYGSAETRGKDMAFEKGGYYAKPVPIQISKALEPLPSLLLENPMNLLYFHHFLNHTARILVPHDCEQNPFRQILPESK